MFSDNERGDLVNTHRPFFIDCRATLAMTSKGNEGFEDFKESKCYAKK